MGIIQGLLSISDYEDHIFMHLIESAPFNFGKPKLYEGVPGNLVAFGVWQSAMKPPQILLNSILNRNKMGYIKEPKGVDFVVEPHVVTEDDKRIISEAIAHYKATGKFKRAPKPKKVRKTQKRVKK